MQLDACQTSWVNYDQLSHKSSCHRRKLFLLPGLPNCEQWHLAKGGALESAGRICHKHLEEETTLTASSSFRCCFSETTRTFAHCMVTFFSYLFRTSTSRVGAIKALNLSALNHPVMCLFPSHPNEPKLSVEKRDADASAVANCICICHGFQEC